jgi:protein tyrosine/serine phosphatase
MTVPTNLTRDIALEVAYNVRHLGGYSARDGHQTSNQLIRAGSLHRLTEAGIDRLRELEVQAVVDLRSPQEQAGAHARSCAGWYPNGLGASL